MQMDPFIQYFLVWTITGIAGVINIVISFSACFDRRHSVIPLVIYFLAKNTAVSYLTAAFIYRPQLPWIDAAMVTVVSITAVLNLYVLWFTWKGDPIKIGIAGIFSDIISGMTMVIGASLMNMLANQTAKNDFRSLTVSDAAGVVVVSVSLFILAVKLLRRPVAFFRNYEIRHRITSALMVITSIAVLSGSNIKTRKDISDALSVPFLLSVIILIPVLLLMIRRLRADISRKELLKSRAEMTEAYMMAVEAQAAMVEEQRKTLDSIECSTDSSFRTDVRTATASAKKTSKAIKKLTKGKKYYIRIRAYTESGGAEHVSKWSAAKAVKVK